MNYILLILFTFVLSSGAIAKNIEFSAPLDTPADRIILPTDEFIPSPDKVIYGDVRQKQPRRDDIIGESFQAGDTYYDYQSNGTVGKMIALDTDGGIHVTWMDLYNTDIANGNRHQKYNYFVDDEWMDNDGVQIDVGNRGGYGAIALTEEEIQRAMAFYHMQTNDGLVSYCGIDIEQGIGAFISAALPSYPTNATGWAQGVQSPDNGMIHVVMNRSDAGMISYTQGYIDRNGEPVFEEDFPLEVSETHVNSYRIARSPHSDRVAITWQMTRTAIPAPEGWDGFLAYQMNNDIYMVVSDDGEDWDFDNPINVTSCISPNLDIEYPYDEDGNLIENADLGFYGDTLRPFSTHDVIFDDEDNIHVVFDARGLWENPLAIGEDLLWDGLTIDASFLFHWSEETDEVTPVADGWFSQRVYHEEIPDSLIITPKPGAWKSNVCNPSLAYDEETGDLYCVFNYFPHGDYANPNMDGGRNNGDVAITVSEDNGETWYYPTPVVVTTTILAEPGEAECELFPTMAERIDDNLHILYEVDTSPGFAVQEAANGAETTLCTFMYQRIDKQDILRDSIWDGSDTWEGGLKFHGEPQESIKEDNVGVPSGFQLESVYPNPFNSRATVKFENKVRQDIQLVAYALDGRKVADIFSGVVLAGQHEVVWNAVDVPSGVYVVRLESGQAQSSMKVALVK